MTIPIGKLPAQALDLEEVVLGALMLEKSAYHLTETILSEEVFYKDAHQLVYSAIKALNEAGNPVDILTVTEYIRSIGRLEDAGGAHGVSQLTSRISSADNIEYHSYIIREKYMQRQMYVIGSEMTSDSFENNIDVFECIEKFSNKITALADVSSVIDNIGSLSDGLVDSILEIERTTHTDGITGVRTGFRELDKKTAGFQKGDLVILAARSGMGKTSLAIQFALNAAEAGEPGAIFSQEVKKLMIIMKMQSNYSEIAFDKLKTNRLSSEDWSALTAASDRLSRYHIAIDDSPNLKIRTLKARCRKLKRQGKLKWVIIDYLQLLSGSEGVAKNSIREQEVAYISRSLKALAMELDIPIIALSQLSREVEKRTNKKPQLSDLRESGQIEADADLVVFIYRPEYYGELAFSDGSSTKNVAQIIIAKYRNGAVGEVDLKFYPEISKFTDFDSEEYQPPVSRPFNEPVEKEIMAGENLNQYANDEQEPF